MVMSWWRRLTSSGISTRSFGSDIGIIAGYADFGRARTTKSVVWSTSQGGEEHARWVFDYDPETWIDDDAGYRFGAHKFAPGEYVSIHDDAGELHTFQVTSVQPVS
jgi:hypothetical protein